jgi:hypothetical protein
MVQLPASKCKEQQYSSYRKCDRKRSIFSLLAKQLCRQAGPGAEELLRE